MNDIDHQQIEPVPPSFAHAALQAVGVIKKEIGAGGTAVPISTTKRPASRKLASGFIAGQRSGEAGAGQEQQRSAEARSRFAALSRDGVVQDVMS